MWFLSDFILTMHHSVSCITYKISVIQLFGTFYQCTNLRCIINFWHLPRPTDGPFKAAGTVLGQQGQSKTKGHFFHFEGHFKGQKISRAFGALNQALLIVFKITEFRQINRDAIKILSQILWIKVVSDDIFWRHLLYGTLLSIRLDLFWENQGFSLIAQKKALLPPCPCLPLFSKRQPGQLPLRFRRPCVHLMTCGITPIIMFITRVH